MAPHLSIILIAYDMAREIPRTVQSWLPPYQLGIQPEDIEIIVVDNGSHEPIPRLVRSRWPNSVRYQYLDNASPSPANALNMGADMARAPLICPSIDGARMASPGIVRGALSLHNYWPEPFVVTLGCHLGPKPQQFAASEGYDQGVEDRLLEKISWPQDGYRLFDIACAAGSARRAWFGPLSETNAPIMTRRFFQSIGGFDERFDFPGGGFVNLDFYRRCLEAAPEQCFMLLGEATFHQYHGGASTSKPIGQTLTESGRTVRDQYANQYRAIRGREWQKPETISPILYGNMTPSAIKFAKRALGNPAV